MSQKAKRRKLKMHPRLLWDVIHRQAGQLSKAVLEGAQNCVDAGATYCNITLTSDRLTITDDGKGFVDLTEIDKFFETFGYPHKEGDAKYGRFRMGRGQLFAFGVNVWRSNRFKMIVDLKPQQDQDGEEFALGYDLIDGLEQHDGCHIDISLYEKTQASYLEWQIKAIKQNLAWLQIPVTLNGQQINKLPQEQTDWDLETDDAYVKFSNSGTMSVYNMGVLVRTYPASQLSSGGTVVSKDALDVNFARNDIQSTCDRWDRIKRDVAAEVKKRLNNGVARMDDAARENMSMSLLSGDISLSQGYKQKILTDIRGTHQSLSVLNQLGRYSNTITVAEKGDAIAEKVHERGLAFVLEKSTLDRFNAGTLKEFVASILEVAERHTRSGEYDNVAYSLRKAMKDVKVADVEIYRKLISNTHIEVPRKNLKPSERLALDAIARSNYSLRVGLNEAIRDIGLDMEPRKDREIRVGESETALAWTDGQSTIWLNRSLLPLIQKGIPGMSRIAGIMLHEYVHDDNDLGSHDHDYDFYRRFHDLSVYKDIIGETANYMLGRVLYLVEMEQKKPTGALKKASDIIANAKVELDLPKPTEHAYEAQPAEDDENTQTLRLVV